MKQRPGETVREWLLEIEPDDRRVVGYDVQTVEFGWPIGMPVCRSLSDGLWEIRSDLNSGKIGRIIFCIFGGEMVLLHGLRQENLKGAAGHRARQETAKGTAMTEDDQKARVSAETFDDFLSEQGMLEETEEVAIKRVLAWQIAEAMKEKGLTKTAMAALMHTDRRQLDRLLDPNNGSVTLGTLTRAANAVGRTLRIELS